MKKVFTKQLILMAIFALFTITAQAQDIVITEIMYNPPESGQDSLEFVEILNNTTATYDMTGAVFAFGNSEFIFPSLMLGAGEYTIVAVNDTAFNSVFGFMPYEWTGSGLSNSKKFITLKDVNGSFLDSLTYYDDWSSESDGGGASLVLCDVKADNNLGSNWIGATTGTGVMINGKEIKANPNAASGCPSGIEVNNDDAITATDVSRPIDVLENDVLVGAVSSLVVSTPTLGTASVNADNEVDYTPPAGSCGVVDEFTYTVTMDNGQTGTATVKVTVLCAPDYTIGLVTTEDAAGVADSLEVICTLTGVVYGVDMIGGTGVQFTMIDANGDGIAVRRGDTDLDYTVTEGDEVSVVGMVDQFRGLIQFSAGKITKNSAGNTLLAPTVVTQLGEDTESKLVKLENMYVVDMTKWSDSGSGFNIKITNGGADTIAVRIDKDVDAYGNATLKSMVDGATFNLTGIGAQYDSSSPYTDGYQIFPRYVADFDIVSSTNNPALQENINIYPNPTTGDFVIATRDLKVDEIRLVNLLGQTLTTVVTPDAMTSLSLGSFPKGVYYVNITAGDSFTTMKVQKF